MCSDPQTERLGTLRRSLLPGAMPDVDGWRFALFQAADSWAGGDYHDLILFPNGNLAILLADASGHNGVAAALVVLVRLLMHCCPLTSGQARRPFCPCDGGSIPDPDITLTHFNRVLFETVLPDQFLTAFLGHLNPQSGELRFASAGHPLPRAWRRASGEVAPLDDISGLPLGVDEAAGYRLGRTELHAGDVLICYTDGLVETHNDRGDQFGTERIDDVLRRHATAGAEAVREALAAEVDAFRGGAAMEDDTTVLIVERRCTQ